MEIKRGDIFYVHSNNETPIGREIWSERPAVVVSNNAINKESPTVIVVYTTTKLQRMSTRRVGIISGKDSSGTVHTSVKQPDPFQKTMYIII